MAAENILLQSATTDTASARFNAVIEQHGPSLLRLAAAYTNTIADRDDLFQETALSIWQALPKFRNESSERTFIFRIAHNRAMTHLARRPKQPTEPVEEQIVPDPTPNPEQQLVRHQQRAALLTAIRRLPIDYRRVIVLILEGLSHAEAADVLGINISNVAVRVNRTKQMLRDLLHQEAQ
jgi:RNA polymerase sigma-70 factor (ECF subfamily)